MNRQVFSQSDIRSFHWVKFSGHNGEVLYALSGIILVNMVGSSQNWAGLAITCKVNIPELPAGMGFFIHYHTPFASLNSIFNQNQANNGGHSVNSFDLVSVHPNGNYGSKEITLALNLAVSDSDAVLYRVGFNVILAGIFRPLPPVDPCLQEVNALNRLENLCDGGYESLISIAQEQLQHAAPPQKAAIVRRIRELQENLNNCPVDLEAARSALNRCRLRSTSVGTVPNESTTT